jgi:hypothetical protein
MRFALIATSVAAAVAVPFAVGASGPQMSGDQFLSAVRCVASQDLARPDAELAAAKYQLNTEARLQPAETAAQARAEVRDIARNAVNGAAGANGSMIVQPSCAGAQLATGVDSPEAV